MSSTVESKEKSGEQEQQQDKWWLSKSTTKTKRRWETLSHNGVMFAPEYVPHGIKMLYDGKSVTLTPQQEEVATYFVQVMERDSAKKEIFRKNFFSEFKKVLGKVCFNNNIFECMLIFVILKGHVIQDFNKCDFTPIYQWHQARLEEKKKMTKEQKKVSNLFLL